MRTARPIPQAAINAILAEPQVEWEPHCVYSGAPIILPKRIVDRLTFDHHTGCFRVSGYNTGNGFANISILGKNYKVHRVVWTIHNGPIPVGHVVDHKKSSGCKYRDCCNDVHLEPTTVKENTHRGDAKLFTRPFGSEG